MQTQIGLVSWVAGKGWQEKVLIFLTLLLAIRITLDSVS
jgi:hypothetical protein